MFSNLNKDYIRSHYKGDTIGAIRYVRSETGADVKTAKAFVDDIFKEENVDNKTETMSSAIEQKSYYKKNYYRDSIEAELKDILEKRRRERKGIEKAPLDTKTYETYESNTAGTDNSNKVLGFLWKIIKLLGRIIIALLITVISAVVWGIYLLVYMGFTCIFVEMALAGANIFLNIGNYYGSILKFFIYIYFIFLVIAIIYSFIAALMGKNSMKKPAHLLGNFISETLDEMLRRQKQQRELNIKMQMLDRYRRSHYRKPRKKW